MKKQLTHITAKKSLGQHFLKNKTVSRKMIEAANVTKQDIVIEIGPGTGALTSPLLETGAHIIAIETDERSIESLQITFKDEIISKQLTLIHTDILETSLSDLGVTEHNYKVVANIPYYITAKLFRTFLESTLQPSTLVFLIQKEVAERIARSKKESLLSLSIKAYGVPKYVKTVSRKFFSPPPKVHSAILAVSDISHNCLQNTEERFFFEILHLGFAAKRKQLLGNLSKKYERELLTNIFSTLSISLSTRGEDLPIEIWLKLVKELATHTQ